MPLQQKEGIIKGNLDATRMDKHVHSGEETEPRQRADLKSFVSLVSKKPMRGFEPRACSLLNYRSTAELHRQTSVL